MFSRRQKSSLSQRPQVWIWHEKTGSDDWLTITRFFFKETLDFSVQVGSAAKSFARPLAAIPGVMEGGVRVYSSYIAVSWLSDGSAPNSPTEQKVVAEGLRVLGERFGWKNVEIGHINSSRELFDLKQKEGVHHLRWKLGMD